jgi:hypothetical protein
MTDGGEGARGRVLTEEHKNNIKPVYHRERREQRSLEIGVR